MVEEADLSRDRLRDLVRDGAFKMDAIERLLKAMSAESKIVKAAKLGLIGKEALTKRLIEIDGVHENVEYSTVPIEGAEPLLAEMAVGVLTPDEEDDEDFHGNRKIRSGINFAPAIKGRIPFPTLLELLQERGREIDSQDPLSIVVHMASPHLQFTDRGKSMLSGGDDDD